MLLQNQPFNDLTVYRAGHNFLLEGMTSYDYLESSTLVYVSKNIQNLYIPDKGYISAPEGSFVFYPPGEQKREYTSPKPGENYWIIFDKIDNDIFSMLSFQPYEIYTAKPSSKINECFETIIEELIYLNNHYEPMVCSMFVQLLITLWRSCNNVSDIQPLSYSRKSGDIAIAVYMMNKQCHKNYTLKEYAKMCNLSTHRFCHKFKEKMKIQPMLYRRNCRLKKSELLMRINPNSSVEKIATDVGFGSTTYFCTEFKNYYNITPSEYMKILKSKSSPKL